MEKIIATKNLDNLITKVEAARLRVSEHHIVKIVGISKYSTIEILKLFTKLVSELLEKIKFKI